MEDNNNGMPETIRVHFANQAQACFVMGARKARPVVVMDKATWESKYLPRLKLFEETQQPL